MSDWKFTKGSGVRFHHALPYSQMRGYLSGWSVLYLWAQAECAGVDAETSVSVGLMHFFYHGRNAF